VNFQGLLTVVVAAACIFAVGVTSSTFDSVETDPSDVFNTSQIPTQSNTQSSSSAQTTLESGDVTKEVNLKQSLGKATEKMQGSQGDMETQGGAGSGQPTSWMEYLLALLVGIVAFVLVFFIARRKFMNDEEEEVEEILVDIDTSNAVYESWWEMVEMADVDEIKTKTPQEIADEVLEKNGTDQEAVVELTNVFEEVYYGGKQVTPDEEKRAREALERIKTKGKKV